MLSLLSLLRITPLELQLKSSIAVMLLLEALNEKTGEAEGARYYLPVGVYSVGRGDNCAILLKSDNSISREHAQLEVFPLTEDVSSTKWQAEITRTSVP